MHDLNWLVSRPIAHRGLHDGGNAVFENTLTAARAALKEKYSIEVDLQFSADGVPVVFHDQTLDRVTSESGNVRAGTAEELARLRVGTSEDGIPSLAQLLETIDGNVGLVLELKGIYGEDEGFVSAVLKTLETYDGSVAIMSFNHWLLADARLLEAAVPVGLTAEGGDEFHETHMEAVTAFDPDFVSYNLHDLPTRFVGEFRGSNRPVITWTVRSEEEKAYSDRFADQITFEGFRP